jgi:hypothetical protein
VRGFAYDGVDRSIDLRIARLTPTVYRALHFTNETPTELGLGRVDI